MIEAARDQGGRPIESRVVNRCPVRPSAGALHRLFIGYSPRCPPSLPTTRPLPDDGFVVIGFSKSCAGCPMTASPREAFERPRERLSARWRRGPPGLRASIDSQSRIFGEGTDPAQAPARFGSDGATPVAVCPSCRVKFHAFTSLFASFGMQNVHVRRGNEESRCGLPFLSDHERFSTIPSPLAIAPRCGERNSSHFHIGRSRWSTFCRNAI